MTPISYYARLEPLGPDSFLVRFPDVPEAITQGATVDEAADQAEDALAVALEGYLLRNRDFPARTKVRAAEPVMVVEIPVKPVIAALWLLRREMRRQNISDVALGQLMKRDEKSIRRLVTGKGASIDSLFRALQALGVRPALGVYPAAIDSRRVA